MLVVSLRASALLVLLPSVALAHTGGPHVHGLIDGLSHPMLGLDHLLAMVAVGIWGAHLGGRSQWSIPASFLVAMALGGMVGAGEPRPPLVEGGIIASILIVGLLIAAAVMLPMAVSMSLVGLMALFHGYAHGVEIPSNASGVAYGMGFVLSTAMLHGVGLYLGRVMERCESPVWLRFGGVAIVVAGLVLAVIR